MIDQSILQQIKEAINKGNEPTQVSYPPNETLYLKNLNEKIKIDSEIT